MPGFICGVDRQPFAKWFSLLQAPHAFPLAGQSLGLYTGPLQYPHVRVYVRGFPRPFGLAPITAYAGSVLMGFGSAASICDACALDSSFKGPSVSMSASGFRGSLRMRTLGLADREFRHPHL